MTQACRDQDRLRAHAGRGVVAPPASAVGLYRLELFHRATNAGPLAARTIDTGILAIGRDDMAAWSIPDPSRTLSRFHCEVSIRDGAVMLRSIGANGVFDESTGARLPHGEPVRIAPPFTFTLGAFRIAVTENDAETPVDLCDPTGFHRIAPPGGVRADPLVAAFCEGAQVDEQTLATADPIRLMRRAGAMYRQALLGICDLNVERDRARANYRVGDGGIGDAIANPFEWTPAQRLASDLLVAQSSDFLPGPAAIATSFDNIRRHLVATTAAYAGALDSAAAAGGAGDDGNVARAFAATYEACEKRMRAAKPAR